MNGCGGIEPRGELSDGRTDRRAAYPSLRHALGLVALAILLQSLLFLPVSVVQSVTGSQIADHPGVLAAVNSLALGIVFLWGLRRSRSSVRDVLPHSRIRAALLVPVTLVVVGAGIVLSEIDNLFRSVFPPPPWLADLFSRLAGGERSLWGSVLALVVVAPITEEFLFRGLILRGLRENYGARTAIVGSALLFGVFHVNPWQFVGTSVLGIMFAWWVVETNSLAPCVFAHALNNALPILLSHVIPMEIPGYTGPLGPLVEFQPLWFDLVGAVAAGLGAWWLALRFRRVPPPAPPSGGGPA
ncbi:MAG: CPBP family intramembrane metalloprotease [Gemmatimonadetes bacterium]|nr:CPBP family intramembrane metalloprotease [Gemmatimonadota bacterium]